MSIRKNYSIPDCPKIGRYDGLGMAAVPLAIADKERELGISHSSSSSYDYVYDDFEEELKETEKDMDDMYNLGKKAGYEKGLIDGRVEVYKKFMEASYNDTLSSLEAEADTFLIMYCPDYK